jgi:long-chain acyl-CoA synthetase
VRVDELLEWRARIDPRKTAVICAGERYSYARLEDESSAFARTLRNGGLRRGDRVAICLENSIETLVSLFAVLKAGGVFFIVNPQARPEYCDSLVADSAAAGMIARDASGSLQVTWRRASANEARLTEQVDPDLAALVYTSGSSGRPKGVMLTHRNMISAAAAICAYLENTADDVILNVLPLSFTYGLGQVTTAFHSGATLVLERSFTYPRAVLETMRRERVTGFAIVPTIATLLLQQDLSRHAFPNLRYITNAAAALPANKIQRLRAAFPATRIYLMYGLTECQRVSYLPPEFIDERPASVGVAIPGTEAYVVDGRGARAEPGAIGELVVRGPHIMKGYWNQPEATAKALRPGPVPGEPVLYTGDLFRTGEDNFLYFVERSDDVIKIRGEKVAPRHVEEVIARLPGVAEVAVYGIPDDISGEAVAASVTPSEGIALTAAQIQRHCLEHLEACMVPKVVEIRDALPTTTTGKVSRRALRLMAITRGESAA